jgi:hypothetical protein
LEGLRQKLAAQTSTRDAVSIILKEKELSKINAVVTLWFLWTNRNAIHEEGRGRNATDLARGIKFYCLELHNGHGMANAQNSLHDVKWRRPPNGVLKLNCDASFRAEESIGSWSFIITLSETMMEMLW